LCYFDGVVGPGADGAGVAAFGAAGAGASGLFIPGLQDDALIGQIERPGTTHPCDVRFGLRVVQILGAAERSLANGSGVPLT